MSSKVLKPVVAKSEPAVPQQTEQLTTVTYVDPQRTSGDKVLDVLKKYEEVNHTKGEVSDRAKMDVALKFDINEYWENTSSPTDYFSQAVKSARKGSGLTPSEFGIVDSLGLTKNGDLEQSAKDFQKRHEALSKGELSFLENSPMTDNEWMAHYMYSLTDQGKAVEGNNECLFQSLKELSEKGLTESGKLTERQEQTLQIVSEDFQKNGAKPSSFAEKREQKEDVQSSSESKSTPDAPYGTSGGIKQGLGNGLSGVLQQMVMLFNQLLESLRGGMNKSKETFTAQTENTQAEAKQVSQETQVLTPEVSQEKHAERVAEAEEMTGRVCSNPRSATKSVALER